MNRNVYRMFRLWMVAGMAFCAISPAFGAGVFYVVPNGAGTTGTSWADAFGAIQPAIDAAVAAGGGERLCIFPKIRSPREGEFIWNPRI